MGFQLYFFQRFSSRVLANQIHSYIAAKMFANATHVPENIAVHIENNPKFHSSNTQQALFIVQNGYKVLPADPPKSPKPTNPTNPPNLPNHPDHTGGESRGLGLEPGHGTCVFSRI
jgi:hypothetical protein